LRLSEAAYRGAGALAVAEFAEDINLLISMGLSPEEREALQKAASAEDKPMAYVARRAAAAWLKEQG
jgi:hypothetical protein